MSTLSIIIAVAVTYLVIGIIVLLVGSAKFGPPEGETIVKALLFWPRYLGESGIAMLPLEWIGRVFSIIGALACELWALCKRKKKKEKVQKSNSELLEEYNRK